MTEILAGVSSETVVRDSSSRRVLTVLNRIADGGLESTEEITDVYGDVDRLMLRVQAVQTRFEELGVSPSPFLAHLRKMDQIEREIHAL